MKRNPLMFAAALGISAALTLGAAEVSVAAGQIAHRRAVRAAFADRSKRAAAIEAALKDEDPAVRRYAVLNKALDLGSDQEALKKLGGEFAKDPAADVRLLAKSLNRKGGLFRLNEPLSLSPLNDHETVKVATAKRNGPNFSFEQKPEGHEAVELWFGRPNQDLNVWVNGVFVGQFDNDLSHGQEFRLDVTRETKLEGENAVVIRDATGKDVGCGYTALALHW